MATEYLNIESNTTNGQQIEEQYYNKKGPKGINTNMQQQGMKLVSAYL